MEIKLILLLALVPLLSNAQDSVSIKKKYWLSSLVEVQVINTSIWAFDRVFTNLAQDNPLKGIKDNAFGKYTWDNSYLRTNFLGHPYHGNLYYNASRSNGLSYYLAIPVSLTGSWIWELGAEKELPSINDLIVTPLAGAAWGEVLYRVGHLFYDRPTDRYKTLRTIGGIVTNPVGSINRFAFKRDKGNLYSDFTGYIGIDNVYRFDNGKYIPEITASIEYGNTMDDFSVPYEWFTASVALSFEPKPYISRAEVIGKLYSKTFSKSWNFGVYQHFSYDVSGSSLTNDKLRYLNAEGVSYGLGMVYDKGVFQSQFYGSGIILGAYKAERFPAREYNLGSGYSVKSFNKIDINKIKLHADVELFRQWSWDGKDNSMSPDYTGDKSDNLYIKVSPSLSYRLSEELGVALGYTHRFSKSWYSDKSYIWNTDELQLCLYYIIL